MLQVSRAEEERDVTIRARARLLIVLRVDDHSAAIHQLADPGGDPLGLQLATRIGGGPARL